MGSRVECQYKQDWRLKYAGGRVECQFRCQVPGPVELRNVQVRLDSKMSQLIRIAMSLIMKLTTNSKTRDHRGHHVRLSDFGSLGSTYARPVEAWFPQWWIRYCLWPISNQLSITSAMGALVGLFAVYLMYSSTDKRLYGIGVVSTRTGPNGTLAPEGF